ncbi:DUF2459 domain-containing protein [Humisphaera borealis]|uniref:DUF2459 domain-containing protein n=1 Tax=Humisphaera borealis TaxID=2807512 RepID=A0A7M2WUS2_9BACT|nr:DUF2459 domain-containing protein [Humisphaera borealis]QOV88932.1 DUF2459 domain-containing protein [Humisphaera borealis]
MMSNRIAIRLVAAALLTTLAGCTQVQSAGQFTDPVRVYIGDYGIHSSLFLPTQDNRYVEYAFGDWGYAVENRNLPQDALGALTASWGAGFGRMYHGIDAETSGPNPPRKPVAMQAVTCDRPDVYTLIDKLDVHFEQLAAKNGSAVVNPETGMSWVREDRDKRYSIANNCNHLTAKTLEDLGCKVSGLVVWSKFSVSAPATASAPPPPKKPAEKIAGWAAIE